MNKKRDDGGDEKGKNGPLGDMGESAHAPQMECGQPIQG